MSDMTIGEAVSILGSVVTNLKAARRLEEALKVAQGVEQSVLELSRKKTEIDELIRVARDDLKLVEQEIETETARQKTQLDELQSQISTAKSTLSNLHAEEVAKITAVEETASKAMEALKEHHDSTMSELMGDIDEKSSELSNVNAVLNKAQHDLDSLAAKLSA